jgi:hypothetical protein
MGMLHYQGVVQEKDINITSHSGIILSGSVKREREREGEKRCDVDL